MNMEDPLAFQAREIFGLAVPAVRCSLGSGQSRPGSGGGGGGAVLTDDLAAAAVQIVIRWRPLRQQASGCRPKKKGDQFLTLHTPPPADTMLRISTYFMDIQEDSHIQLKILQS